MSDPDILIEHIKAIGNLEYRIERIERRLECQPDLATKEYLDAKLDGLCIKIGALIIGTGLFLASIKFFA